MSESTLETLTRVGVDNKRIAQRIKRYFVDIFSAFKLQADIQNMEKSMKTLELKVAGIELFTMFTVGKDHPGFISDMKEQLEANHDSIAYERNCIVSELDFNIQQLDHARAGLESDTPELIALNKVIEKLGAFAWAFKDSRADMVDLFAVPDVLQIYNEAVEKAGQSLKV